MSAKQVASEKTVKVSNRSRWLITRDIACNQMRKIALLESWNLTHIIAQSTSQHIAIYRSNRKNGKNLSMGGWAWSSAQNPPTIVHAICTFLLLLLFIFYFILGASWHNIKKRFSVAFKNKKTTTKKQKNNNNNNNKNCYVYDNWESM